MSVGVEISNMYHKNVIEQETNHHNGKNENKLSATNEVGDPNNLNNKGEKIIILFFISEVKLLHILACIA